MHLQVLCIDCIRCLMPAAFSGRGTVHICLMLVLLIVQVSPEGGVLPAGESAGITVRFTPHEVEDCSRRLVATIPNLASTLQVPNRPMSASVLRPWCHFDLPPSDYITAGQLAIRIPVFSCAKMMTELSWLLILFNPLQSAESYTLSAKVAQYMLLSLESCAGFA